MAHADVTHFPKDLSALQPASSKLHTVLQNEKLQVFSGCHPKEGTWISGRNQIRPHGKIPLNTPDSQQMVVVTLRVNLLTWETMSRNSRSVHLN